MYCDVSLSLVKIQSKKGKVYLSIFENPHTQGVTKKLPIDRLVYEIHGPKD